jgi:hypothetical protein
MTSFNINKATHKDVQKQEKIRNMTRSPNENEAQVAAKKLRPSASVSLPLKNEYEPSLAELVLGEEMCGKGHYWCNTDKKCKKIPSGFKISGQPSGNERTEVGIGKPVAEENECNHSKKGKNCPVHGIKSCDMKEENVTIEDMFGNKFVEFIDLITPQDVIDEKRGLWDNIHARREAGEPRKKPGQKGYPKILNVENHIDVAMGKELDDEGSMILNQLNQLEMHCKRMKGVIRDPKMQVPAWVQSKVTLATDYMDAVANYMSSKNEEFVGEGKKESDSYLETDMKKRRENNEKAIEDMKKTKAHKDMVAAARKKLIGEAVRLPSEYGNLIGTVVMWRGKTQQITMFFPQTKIPSRKDVQREVEKIYPGGKVIRFGNADIASNYSAIDAPIVRVGFYGGNVGKPGPSKNYVKPMGEGVEVDEDWQSVNRKDKTDGLSQKAVNSYRRENPGSNLQTAVTEKKPSGKRAKRRSSFCSRMKGMKSKLTSTKTARDPDSNINKALRRWNCN